MMDIDDAQPQPASTRLPTELKVEIWKHYFTTVTLPTTEMKNLSPEEQDKIPQWFSLYRGTYLRFVEESLPAMRPLMITQPALLQTCKTFREEALPLYLEELQSRKRDEAERQEIDFLLKFTLFGENFTVAEGEYEKLRRIDCRITVLTQEIARVRRELDITEPAIPERETDPVPGMLVARRLTFHKASPMFLEGLQTIRDEEDEREVKTIEDLHSQALRHKILRKFIVKVERGMEKGMGKRME